MHINLKHNGGAKRLPKPVKEYMKARFKLLPGYLELLKCFEYQGTVGEKQVRRFSIFSSEITAGKHKLIETRKDLEQHPEMLLFEGHIDGQGNAYIADRRTPTKMHKADHSGLTTQ